MNARQRHADGHISLILSPSNHAETQMDERHNRRLHSQWDF